MSEPRITNYQLLITDSIESAKEHPELRHALGRIPEHGNRVLRVIYNGAVDPVRIVTVYFDRKLRDKL